MPENRYWTYVLRNPTGQFYIGLTEDVDCRLKQHNSGVSKWTKGRGPWELVWGQGPMSLAAARKLENRLKRQKGGIGFYYVTGLKPDRSSGS
jgi:putative endonuclease